MLTRSRHLVGLAMRICVEKGFHRKTPEVSNLVRRLVLEGAYPAGNSPSIPDGRRGELQDLLVNIHFGPAGLDHLGSSNGQSRIPPCRRPH